MLAPKKGGFGGGPTSIGGSKSASEDAGPRRGVDTRRCASKDAEPQREVDLGAVSHEGKSASEDAGPEGGGL